MHGARKPSGPKTHYGGSGYDFTRVLLNLISFINVYAITDIESYSMSATPPNPTFTRLAAGWASQLQLRRSSRT